MKTGLTGLLEDSPWYWPLRNWYCRRVYKRQLHSWHRGLVLGAPPHAVKQLTLKAYAEAYGLRLFVETGTCIGDMVEALKHDFETLYSIELSERFFERARKRFRKDDNVVLLRGDSGDLLQYVIEELDSPALFWLDSHWSGGDTARGLEDTPILTELRSILEGEDLGHVIIIDDAREFGHSSGYPSLAHLERFVKTHRTDMRVSVTDDMIRITRGSSAPTLAEID